MIIRRNPHFLANQLFFLSYVFYFLVGLSIFTYNMYPLRPVIEVFIRLALSSSCYAACFLYLGTRVVFLSSSEVNKKLIITLLLIATGISITIIFWPNLVEKVSIEPPVNNVVNQLALLIPMVWQMILVFSVNTTLMRLRREMINTLEKEGKRGDKPLELKKIEWVMTAHWIGVIGIILLLIGNAAGMPEGDFLLYLMSSIDFMLTAYALLKREGMKKS
ncbi:MAG: hypothetical protein ACFFCS_11620 [Candidatus Hodarchaeota archaeon]